MYRSEEPNNTTIDNISPALSIIRSIPYVPLQVMQDFDHQQYSYTSLEDPELIIYC